MDNKPSSAQYLPMLEPVLADIASRFRDLAVPRDGRMPEPEQFLVYDRSFHQVQGALEILGEKATARYTALLRLLCEALGRKRIVATDRNLAVARQASLSLENWLADARNGRENGVRPLLKDFVDLSECLELELDTRELFFPGKGAHPPMAPRTTLLAENLLPEFYRHQAARCRQALGKLAENPAEEELKNLLHALSTIERAQTDPEQWEYWWIGKAVAEAAVCGGMEFSPPLMKVLERLVERMEWLAEERCAEDGDLIRDGLFLIAQSRPVTKEIEDIQRLYALDPGFAPLGDGVLPAEATIQALNEALAEVESAKAGWLEYARGNPHWYSRYHASLSRLNAGPAGDEGFKQLVQWLVDCSLNLFMEDRACDDDLDMEMASALLVLEHSLANGKPRGSLGGNQFETLRQRLKAVLRSPAAESRPDNRESPSRVEFETDEGEIKQAVSGEILNNLREIEAKLDRYFRDPQRHEDLAALAPLFKQAEGAMLMLECAKPARSLSQCASMVREFGQAGGAPPAQRADQLAEQISVLIFYFQELQNGAPGGLDWFDDLMEHSNALGANLALSPQPDSPESPAYPMLNEAAASPPRNLAAEPEASYPPNPEATTSVVETPAPTQREPERPAAATPPAAGKPGIEPELLEIFLGEAGEILAMLPSQLEACRAAPENLGLLTEIRRAFHTLKGSGRMVGQTELGEAAWIVEHSLNLWLEKQCPATPELSSYLGLALASMRDWISRLAESGAVEVDYGELRDHGDQLKDSLARHEPAATDPIPAAGIAAAEPVESHLSGKLEPEKQPAAAPAPETGNPLLEVFIEEALELLPRVGESIRAWRDQPQEPAHARSMLRVLHTLKGSARLAGATRLGEYVHRMESEAGAAASLGQREPGADWFDRLEEQMDILLDEFDQLTLANFNGSDPGTPDDSPTARDKPSEAGTAPSSPVSFVRVRADQLNHFALQSGEASIARIRMETELRQLRQAMKQLNETTGIMRDQLRELAIQAEQQMQSRRFETPAREEKFDPLEFDRFTRLQELTRMLAESAHDIHLVQQDLNKNLGRAESVVTSQARVTRDLHDRLTQIRLVSFTRVADRLHRLVRQDARQLGKRAELKIHGGQVDLDVGLLDRIVPSLEHLLRNALAHGLESPERRAALGKSEAGLIELRLTQEPAGLVIQVGDDGAGIDFARVRARAEALGLIDGETPAQEELAQFLFNPGFSTNDLVSDISGRGIGLDVVGTEARILGGRVELETRPGQGTTFTLRIPAKQTTNRVVPVRAGGQIHALPTTMVEHVGKFEAAVLGEAARDGKIVWAGKDYQFHELQGLMGDTESRPVPAAKFWLVFLSGAQGRIAVVVDELLSTQEVVLKDPGSQVARLRGIKGATVLSGGQLVLIVDPVELAYREDVRVASIPAAQAYAAAPVVMVVDDSITVRTVTQRFLVRHGFQVATAKDGIDALEQMQQVIPDLILVDIEMPRMDGFDLTENIRNTRMLAHIPIIMISSRTADKHRQQALNIGVSAFLGKPYQDSELLSEINGLLNPPAERAVAR